MLNEEDEREKGKSLMLFEGCWRSFQVEVIFPYRVEQGKSVRLESGGESGIEVRAETKGRVINV